MSDTNSNNNVSRGAGCFGWIGGVSAAVCSYALNKSLLWALLHSIFGWLYLLYLLLGFGGGVPSIAF